MVRRPGWVRKPTSSAWKVGQVRTVKQGAKVASRVASVSGRLTAGIGGWSFGWDSSRRCFLFTGPWSIHQPDHFPRPLLPPTAFKPRKSRHEAEAEIEPGGAERVVHADGPARDTDHAEHDVVLVVGPPSVSQDRARRPSWPGSSQAVEQVAVLEVLPVEPD